MYVPNYVPDPIEVPDNVTEASHRTRLGFVRRVYVLHLASLLGIVVIALIPWPPTPVGPVLVQFGLLLVALSLVRIRTRATRYDLIFSASLLPIFLVFLALLARAAEGAGFPLWGGVVGAAAATAYAMTCGRDFSFVGQFLLALIASSVVLAICALELGYSPASAAALLGFGAVYLFYLVYDSASLLARRRLGEELAAVVDLYRDVLNVFGYVVRVARHWRKHRIWAR